MTPPIRSYDEYNRSYVQPAASVLEQLMARFAVDMDTERQRRDAMFGDVGGSSASMPAPRTVTPWNDVTSTSTSLAAPIAPASKERGRAQDISGRGFFGRYSGGQLTPRELSDVDLKMEAEELGIGNAGSIPRTALENIVGAQRKQKQAASKAGVVQESLSSVAGGFMGIVEDMMRWSEKLQGDLPPEQRSNLDWMNNLDGRNDLHRVTTQERNREWMGTLKAKLRLSLPEERAAQLDRSIATGNFVGPFVAQAATYKAVGVVGKAAQYVPGPIGTGAQWLFNGGIRGEAVSAGMAQALWDAEEDKPWLPKSEEVEALLMPEDKNEFAQAAGAVLDSRVGSIALAAGLGAVVGRLMQRGATKMPSATLDPTWGTPTQRGIAAGPEYIPDGVWSYAKTPQELASTPELLAGQAQRRLMGLQEQTDIFGWTPPKLGPGPVRPTPGSTVPDVVPNNIARTADGAIPMTGVVETATPRKAALELFEEFQAGRPTWPSKPPVPIAGSSMMEAAQNLPSARMARARGTALMGDDGMLFPVLHETSAVFDQFDVSKSARSLLTGPGQYVRDVLTPEYAEISSDRGYAKIRAASNQGTHQRVTEYLEQAVAKRDIAMSMGGKNAPQQIAMLDEAIEKYKMQLAEVETVAAPNTHMMWAVIKKPFYFDAAITQDRMQEILDVVRTDEAFAPYRKSLEDSEGEFDALFKSGTQGSRIDPLAQRFYEQLGQLSKVDESGKDVWLYKTEGVNKLLQAAGYDAIHNIGGMRAGKNLPGEMKDKIYNAWNILDPSNNLIHIYAPPPMDTSVAEVAAEQLSKVGAVIDSPIVDVVGVKDVVQEADVANATIASMPRGIQMLRNIKDPGKLMQSLSTKGVGANGITPTSFRMVPREMAPGTGVMRFDAMISTGKEITDDMVADYTKHGVFSGMQGVNSKGVPIEVAQVVIGTGEPIAGSIKTKVGVPYVIFRNIGVGTNKRLGRSGQVVNNMSATRLDNFLSNRASNEWATTQDPTLQKMAGEFLEYRAKRAGSTVDAPLTDRDLLNMPTVFAEFAHSKSIPPEAQVYLGHAIQDEIVELARSIIPDEIKTIDDRVASDLFTVGAGREAKVQELAHARGLIAVREAGTARWSLEGPNNRVWHMENDAAARAFLGQYDVTPQDLSMSGVAFPEVSRSLGPDVVVVDGPTLAQREVQEQASADLIETLAASEVSPTAGALGSGRAQALPGATATAAPAGTAVAGAGSGAPGGVPPGGRPPIVGGGTGGNAPFGAGLPMAAKAVGRITRKLDGFWWKHMMPAREFFDELENQLEKAGAPGMMPGRDTYDLRQSIAKFHNTSEPHIEALTQRMNVFQSDRKRNGHVWRAWTNTTMVPTQASPVSRQVYMQTHKFNAKERAAVAEFDSMLDPIHGPNANMIKTMLTMYVNTVERNLARGTVNPYDVGTMRSALAPIEHFMAHAEKRQLRLEVPEMGTIMHEYLTSYFWSKEVEPQWVPIKKKWAKAARWTDPRGATPIKPLADYVLGWMQGVEGGFQQQNDPLISGVQSALDKFGVPLTKRETVNLVSGTMSSTYRALLGWNTSTIIRDGLQFVTAIPYLGVKHIASAAADLGGRSGNRVRTKMWQDAIDEGWAERSIPPLPEVDVNQSAILPGIPLAASEFDAAQEARRAFGQKVGDFLTDLTPTSLRSVEGTKLDPLWAYTQQGVIFRVVVTNAAVRNFDEVLGTPAASADLVKKLNANALSRRVQRDLEERLDAGDIKGARNLYATSVADAVYGRFGSKESALGNHTMLGRMGTQLGGFTSNLMGQLNNIRKAGFGTDNKVLYGSIATAGAFIGSLKLLEEETGLRWTRLNPWNFLNNPRMLGGPLVEPAWKLMKGAEGAAALALGDGSRLDERNMATAIKDVPGDILRMAGAPGAAFRQGTGLVNAAQNGMLPEYLGLGERRQPEVVAAEQATQRFTGFIEQQTGSPAVTPLATMPSGSVAGAQAMPQGLPALPDAMLPGVLDPARVYEKNGKRVYDSTNRGVDGKVPTHNIDAPSGRQENETWDAYEQRVLEKSNWSSGVENTNQSLTSLVPEAAAKIQGLIAVARSEGIELNVGETLRTQERQEYLFQKGRVGRGSPVTWTLTSNHTPGKAADLVASSPAGYRWIQENAGKFGLRVLGDYDPGHVELVQQSPTTQDTSRRGGGGAR